MKLIKLVIGCVVIFLGFIIIGESHHFYLENFTNLIPSTTLYQQAGIPEEEMKSDVLQSAQNNNVSFFILESIVKSTFEKKIIIYSSSEQVEKYLANAMEINERKYQSIFSGVVDVQYKKYENVSNITQNHVYYVIGKEENIKAFKMDLIDKYAGNHPNYGSKNNESRNLVLIIWAMIYMLILLLTIYDMLMQQKEVLIRMIYGEEVCIIVIKNILLDTICYLLMLGVIYFFLKQFTTVDFFVDLTIKAFIVFIALNSLIYLKLFFLDIRRALTTNSFSTEILFSTYIIKAITVVIAVFVIASNLLLVLNSVEYYSQKDFFESHSDYYYTNLGYKPSDAEGMIDDKLEETSLLREKFYKEFFDLYKPISLVYFGELEDRKMILANFYAKDYIFSVIPEIREKIKENKYYYILPDDINEAETLCKYINTQMVNYDEEEVLGDYELIKYKEEAKVLTIDEMQINGSYYSENPIIILNNIIVSSEQITSKPYPFKNNYEHDIMYKIDMNLFQQFITENELETQFHAITNVLEKYNYNWLIVKRTLYLNMIFGVLILLLEAIIIRTIINLEFKVNATEISLKKILGYGFWKRYSYIITISLIGCIFSIAIGLVICFIFKAGYWPCVIYSGGCIWCIEILVIRNAINKMEKMNIANILKGEYI